MRASILILALGLGLSTLAQAQWTATSMGTAMGGMVSNDPVALAVSKMLETIVQPKQQMFGSISQTAAQAQASMAQQYAAVKTQAEAALAAYEAQYCSAPVLKKSVKRPASFVGQSFAITFTTGNCTFNETKFLVDGIKELDCTEPSITYVKNPANFTSHYQKAASFIGKECKIEKTFGEQVDKVLYVFDSSQPALDVAKLTQQLTNEIKGMLSSIGGSASSAFGNVFGGSSSASAGASAMG